MDLKVARATVLEEWKGIKATTARVLFAIGARRGTPSIWDRVRFGNGLRRASKLRPGGNSVGLAMRRQSPNRAAASQRGTRTVWPGVLLLLFTGCGSPPDLRDPETLDRILAEAVDMDVLQIRGDDDTFFYAPNESDPYSGWAKRMHEPSPQVAELYRFDAGLPSSLFAWHENGQMACEAQHFEPGLQTGQSWAELMRNENGLICVRFPTNAPLANGPAGRWISWYENGQMEREQHFDGYGTGRWVEWHENGQMKLEGHYEAGERTGRWVEWYENGQKEREGHYEAGEPTGRWVAWYSNGQMELEEHYEAGVSTGRWVEWYPNGQMEREEHYEAGDRTGRWVAWYENGQMEREEHYEAGDRTGRWVAWDSDGEREIEFDYDSNSFTVGNRPVAQLPLRSNGSISADTQFVFESAPGCSTRVEVEGSFASSSWEHLNPFADLSNVWTGERVWMVYLRRRGETYSHTINDAHREHYRLHVGSRRPRPSDSFQLEVAATNCDD